MTIGEKIKKFRIERNLSQKQLAIMSGMSEPAIRNYELGNRQPSEKQLEKIAQALNISMYTLKPNLDTYLGIMHSLFYLEDFYNLKITEIEGIPCLTFKANDSMYENLYKWNKEKTALENGEITKEDYDMWRYSFPRIEEERFKKAINEIREKKRSQNNPSN